MTKVQHAPSFQLIIGNGQSEKVDHPSVSVRWCANPALLELISKHGADLSTTKVLLRVMYLMNDRHKPYWREGDRQLVPLADGMCYVDLTRPGKFVILADIVDNKDKKEGFSTKRLFARDDSGKLDYCELALPGHIFNGSVQKVQTKIMEEGNPGSWERLPLKGSARSYLMRLFSEYERDADDKRVYHLDVNSSGVVFYAEGEAPAELFATYPSWVKALANLGHSKPAENQCIIRRRLMLSVFFTIWIFAVVASAVLIVRLIALVWYSIWLVPTKPTMLFNMDDPSNPISSGLGYPDFDTSWFIVGRSKLRSLMINPATAIGVSLVGLLGNYLMKYPLFETIVTYIGGVLAATSAILATAYVCYAAYNKYANKTAIADTLESLADRFDKWSRDRTIRKSLERQARYEAAQAVYLQKVTERVSCNNDPIDAIKPVEQLPMYRKPVKVVLKEVQRLVCRPVAK